MNPTPPPDKHPTKRIREAELREIYKRCDVSNNGNDNPMSFEEFREAIQAYCEQREQKAVELYKAQQEVERWDEIHCPAGTCKSCDYKRPKLAEAKDRLARLTNQEERTNNG